MSGQDQDGIYERHDSPFWWASYTDSSGKSTRRSTRIRKVDDPRQIEAKRVRAGFIAELRQPEAVDLPTSTVMQWEELVLEYLQDLEKRLAKSTILRYEHALKWLMPRFSGKPANAISRREVKTYIRDRQATGAKPASINKEIALMQGMYSWAVLELEWEIENPWRKMTLSPDNARTRYLSREEADRLVSAAERQRKAPYLSDFIRLILHTGMRPGEALSLRWDRVDLDRGLIHFAAKDQKNRKKATIPINATARLVLLSRNQFAKANNLISPWVICGGNGQQIKSVRKGFTQACSLAHLEDVRPHDLRRTFASWLVQEGVSIQTVSGLLRHADIQITHQIYAHLSPEQYAGATAVLDAPPKLRVIQGDVSR